jgi:hypothetical protein
MLSNSVSPRGLLLVWLLSGLTVQAQAGVELINAPSRERVEIHLDHPAATFVEEERIVQLHEGQNQVNFSWIDAAVDPHTVLLRLLDQEDGKPAGVKLVSVRYPPQENIQVWTLTANSPGSARIRISYLLDRYSRSFHYRALGNEEESSLDLLQYLQVQNAAGEEYANATLEVGYGERQLTTVGLDQTQQVPVKRYAGVLLRKTYTTSPGTFGYLDGQDRLNVAIHYVLQNRRESRLGETALPAGKVRIFQDQGQRGHAFLGEDWSKFTPLDGELSLYLGAAQDILVQRILERSERRRIVGNLFHQDLVIRYEMENLKPLPVTLDVVEELPWIKARFQGNNELAVEWELGSETTFDGGADMEQTTAERLVLHAILPGTDPQTGKASRTIRKLHLIVRDEW